VSRYNEFTHSSGIDTSYLYRLGMARSLRLTRYEVCENV